MFAVNVISVYDNIGNSQNLYALGSSIFNENIERAGDDDFIALITEPLGTILISDLNYDDTPEILVNDGLFIQIYYLINDQLTTNATLSIPLCNVGIEENQGIMYVNDIDVTDDVKEIMIGCHAGGDVYAIYVANFTDHQFNIEQTITGTFGDGVYGHVIGCDNDKCMSISSDDAASSVIYVNTFNITHNKTATIGVNQDVTCFHRLSHIAVEDYDLDGTPEFIFSYQNIDDPGVDVARILYYNITNLTINQEHAITVQSVDNTDANNCFQDNNSFRMTSPLVANLWGTAGFETAIGFKDASNNFRIRIYDATGGIIDTFPSNILPGISGDFSSNVFTANVIYDAQTFPDVCMGIWDNDIADFKLLCGNRESILFDHEVFHYNYTTPLSFQDQDKHTAVHSIRSKTDTTNGVDLTEILTTFGVFEVVWDPPLLLAGNLTLIFPSPVLQDSSIIIGDDYQNNSLFDLLALSNSNFYYIDDGSVNHRAYLNSTGSIINPCHEAVWKVNTTVEISYKCQDIDGDNVNARTFLYYGTGNEKQANFTNFPTNTFFIFSFTANETTTGATLRMECWDNQNPNLIDFEQLTFSVANQGLQLNDETCSFLHEFPDGSGVSINETVDVPDFIPAPTDQEINNTMDAFMAQQHETLGWGSTAIWLFLMMCVGVAIVVSLKDRTIGTIAAVLALGEIFMLILGVIFGYIGFGFMVLLILTLVVILGIFISRKFMSTHGEG